MPSVVIVKKDDLKNTPPAFQQYVEEYFAPKKVLGVPCMVCATYVCVPRRFDLSACGNPRKGVGPRHMVDLRHFNEGLLEGTSLLDWMRGEGKKLVSQVNVPSTDNVIHVD